MARKKKANIFDGRTSLSINKEIWTKFQDYAENELHMTASMAIHIIVQGVIAADKLGPLLDQMLDRVAEQKEKRRKKTEA